MITQYLLWKFFHILIAILALGTSAGLGIVLEFYGSHPTHGPFLLRAIRRMVTFFVLPGYVLMLVTGRRMEMMVPADNEGKRNPLVRWSVSGPMYRGSHRPGVGDRRHARRLLRRWGL